MKHLTHQCSFLPDSGVWVVFDNELSNPDLCWRLLIQREATEEDLEENHHLEQVGDTMWAASVGILRCPYCAADLYTLSNAKPIGVGEFSLHDHQGWT
jgi:hypothetical protein